MAKSIRTGAIVIGTLFAATFVFDILVNFLIWTDQYVTKWFGN